MSVNRRKFLQEGALITAGLMFSRLPIAPVKGAATEEVKPVKPSQDKVNLSVCIEMIFNDVPFDKRLERVKAVGLSAFEFWGWRGRDLEELRRKKEQLGLKVAAFCCDTGGPLVDPKTKDKFIQGLRDSLSAAKILDTKTLIVTVGNEIPNVDRASQHESIVEILKAGAPLAEESGVTLCVEPLNILVDHKGYYLCSSAEGFQIIDEVGSPNIKLLFDIYHQQITEGNIIANVTKNLEKIAHFHVADVPGRHEPGTGELNYANIFRTISQKGYKGYFGLEFVPTGNHEKAVKTVISLSRI